MIPDMEEVTFPQYGVLKIPKSKNKQTCLRKQRFRS